MGWFQRIFWTLAAGGGAYVAAILALTIPQIQRNATYAHKINPTIYQNLSNVDQFGFHHHQVQPFNVTTPDGTILYAWHILPTHLYRKHAAALKAQSNFGLKTFSEAAKGLNLRLLLESDDAHLIVSFHGNAGHLGSAHRPSTYQQMLGMSTVEKPVHLIAFDYRGFGLSTGSPTESGVIQDGVSLLSLLTGQPMVDSQDLGVQDSGMKYMDPSRIILMGQSFGTFVSTAVFHDWTIRLKRSSFKGLILFASFSSLPKLLETYSIKGFTPPLLSPLMQYPRVQNWLMSKVEDTWETDRRLTALVQEPDVAFDLTIMHAKDDWEIPWVEGKRNWNTIRNAVSGTGKLEEESTPDVDKGIWTSDDGIKRVVWEKIEHGGHNKIPMSEQAKVALLEILDR